MARLTTAHLTALCYPISSDYTRSALAANTGAATTSDYQEAGPHPGQTVPDQDTSRLLPIISGTQYYPIELVTLTGGMPQLSTSGAVQIGWRGAGQTNNQVRGWEPPNWLHQWTQVIGATGSDAHEGQIVAFPKAQKVAVFYTRSDTAGLPANIRVYSPDQASWESAVAIASGSDPSDAIVVTPTDRLIAVVNNKAWRSDDYGATWVLHSSGVYDDTVDWTDYAHARGAWLADGAVVVLAHEEADPDKITQWASDDGLSTLTQVRTLAGCGLGLNVIAMPGGGFALSYIRTADSYPVVRLVASAWERFTQASEIVVYAAAATHLSIAVDPDGLMWAHWVPSTTDGTVRVSTSVDGGLSWTLMSEGLMAAGSASDQPMTNMSACAAAGSVFIAHNWTSTAATTDGSIGLAQAGGWSNLTPTAPGWSNARDWTARSGSGYSAGQSNWTWIPTEKPEDNGWGALSSGSTITLSSGGYLVLASVAGTQRYNRATAASQQPAVAVFEMRCSAGGSITDDDCYVEKWVSNGSHEHRLSVRISTTDFRVRDVVAGTTKATVTIDMTDAMTFLVLVSPDASVDSGVWYRRGYQSEWTTAWTGALTDDSGSPVGTSGIRWGHGVNTTTSSEWLWLFDTESSRIGQGIGTPAVVGRPITATPIPLPLESVTAGIATAVGGTSTAWLSCATGPGALRETYTAEVEADHPVWAIIPTESPSPAHTWRNNDKSEQVIAWDYSRKTWLGDSVILPMLNVNFRTAYLEYYSGGAWVTAGTYDGAIGFTAGLTCNVAGHVVYPDGATAEGARYIQEGELVGGYVILEISGGTGTAARRIVSNTSGWWSAGTSGPEVRLHLDPLDVDGTEDASGDAILVWPSGVLVVHASSLTLFSQWRIRIPQSQVTPDSYYQIGSGVPMACRVLGSAPDWGWSRETIPNVETVTTRYGTTWTREAGPPSTVWAMSWADGVDQKALRGTAGGASVDYVGPSGGYAAGSTTAEDVPHILRGILEATKGGEVPVVALAAVPQTTTTITDRTLYLYGRMSSSVRLDHMASTEGTDEIVRVSEITIAEIV